MEKDFLVKLKDKLKEEEEELEQVLSSFAQRDRKLPGDWDTKFPQFNGKLEESADEVEEFTNLLPIEAKLELLLLDIERALKKMETGAYGICEKCGRKINKKRLRVLPEAKFCSKCARSQL